MGSTAVWGSGIVMLLVIWGALTSATEEAPRVSLLCPPESLLDSILKLRDSNCPASVGVDSHGFSRVIEGNEDLLQRALSLIHKNNNEYVALLFYASWCPFSPVFWPTFSIMSSLYITIPHIAIEESAVRPSIISKYGVYGFPVLFLLNNSTMPVRYHGPRTLGSLVSFYNDVTGMKPAALDQVSQDKIGRLEGQVPQHDNCPFSWARSPENFFCQETYVALATAFVVLRLLHFLYPTMLAYAQIVWRRHIRNFNFWVLLEHPLSFLSQIVLLFSSLRDPCKQRNLQGGAMNAREWASRSLATVSLGDATSSRCLPSNECH